MDANIVTPEVAQDFRLQLQQAREDALKDAEAFDGILHALERVGSFCLGRVENLYSYGDKLRELATLSPLATQIPTAWREVHTPFDVLYGLVKAARNDAMHIGAAARHITIHAIELALILEDALRMCEESDRSHLVDLRPREVVNVRCGCGREAQIDPFQLIGHHGITQHTRF